MRILFVFAAVLATMSTTAAPSRVDSFQLISYDDADRQKEEERKRREEAEERQQRDNNYYKKPTDPHGRDPHDEQHWWDREQHV